MNLEVENTEVEVAMEEVVTDEVVIATDEEFQADGAAQEDVKAQPEVEEESAE